jgi:hypothetical protein
MASAPRSRKDATSVRSPVRRTSRNDADVTSAPFAIASSTTAGVV